MEVESLQEPTKPGVLRIDAHDRRKKEDVQKKPVRMPFPAHLHREVTILVPEGDLSDYVKIGEEATEELELTQAKLFVKRTVREKYARKDGEGVLIASLPARVIDKGMFGPHLLSQILIDKYADHLPLYRQMKRFEREGVKLPYSTLADVPRQTGLLLRPLYDLLSKTVLSSGYLQVDETPTPVLDRKKKGRTHRGYYWVYRSPGEKLVLFDYREGRGRDGPVNMLRDFKGFLQTDGYAVYNDFDKQQDIILAGCMAHARRYFEKAKDSDGQQAEQALQYIQRLYATERIIRERQSLPEEILLLRKEDSLPVLIEMEKWMKDLLLRVTPKSPMGQAIAYCLPRWEKLSRYIYYPSLEIDNNLVENAIRPSVIGRKNYLFAGSHDGACRSAMMYSFFGSCKIHNINPQDWMADVLIRIADTKMSKLHTLLPSNWKAS
jgi:transposase